ncbi:MAG: CBU_0592 family membrane protein [Planctomycetota bacterium]|jgi:hypothetical protein
MPVEPSLAWKVASAAGLLCLVVAYLVNQGGRCRSDGARYLLANALGAGLLAAYSMEIDEPIFVALEGFWCVASLLALARGARPDAGAGADAGASAA